jgi:hypothetical protein
VIERWVKRNPGARPIDTATLKGQQQIADTSRV